MRFLPKSPDDLEAHRDLRYPGDRAQARRLLLEWQRGFCAYSERYLKPLDSVEVEHFDPRLKGTERDGIANWHAVIRWMNSHKARKIKDFEPLPNPSTWDPDRVVYRRGLFACRDESDEETRNLIEFLGVNKPEVYQERTNHVAMIRKLRDWCSGDDNQFEELLTESPENLAFPSALHHELGIPAFDLIARTIAT